MVREAEVRTEYDQVTVTVTLPLSLVDFIYEAAKKDKRGEDKVVALALAEYRKTRVL